MKTYDALFIADHFIMVTTIELDETEEPSDVERAAWNRLGAEYGIDWTGMTRQFIKNVSIQQVENANPQPSEPSEVLGHDE